MTVTEPKSLEEILAFLKDAAKVFIVGCSDCATVLKTGGEPEVKQMAETLTAHGKAVVGTVIGEPGCHLLNLKRQFREHKEQFEEADALLVMSCGTGTQTAALAADHEKPVWAANNTLYLGQVERQGHYRELCSACGECTLDRTAAICPVTRCAKGLQNGPCGGTTAEGKCEVSPDRDCAWYVIHEKMKAGGLEALRAFVPAKDARLRPGLRPVAPEGGKS
jgi:hypothetical protein